MAAEKQQVLVHYQHSICPNEPSSSQPSPAFFLLHNLHLAVHPFPDVVEILSKCIHIISHFLPGMLAITTIFKLLEKKLSASLNDNKPPYFFHFLL